MLAELCCVALGDGVEGGNTCKPLEKHERSTQLVPQFSAPSYDPIVTSKVLEEFFFAQGTSSWKREDCFACKKNFFVFFGNFGVIRNSLFIYIFIDR